MNKEKIKNEVKNIQNLFLSKNYKLIIQTSKKAIEKYPKISIFYNLLGLALNNLGEYTKAITILLEGYKINSKDTAILNNLGNAYKYNYDYENAEKFYQKAIELNQNYFHAYLNYGNLKREINLFKEANDLYNKALKINQNDPIINYALAMSYQSLGNFKKSNYYAEETLKLEPKFTKADLLLSRSKQYKKNDNHLNKMIDKLKNLELNEIQKAELNFAISKAFEDLKNINESVNYLKKGNKIKNDLVKYNLNEEKKIYESIKKIYLKINMNQLSKNYDKNEKKIIFILGMPRSGTTLVEQIISAHPEVYGSGELPYIKKIIRDKFIDNNELSEEKLKTYLYNKDKIQEISKKYFSYLKEYKIKENYITDKAPLNFYWLGYIKLFFPNSKIIHCSREAKDNCLSLYKNFFEGKLDFCYSEHNLSSFYNLYKDIMQFWTKLLPNNFLNINYEDLVDNQTEEIGKLLSYCELNWNDACLNFSKNKNPIKTVSISQARNPIYKSSVKSYEKYKLYLNNLFEKL
tara:strand:- start:3407 stop:4966 length:1560 start_codon:yes stop_codon:yes gene_type:complete